MVVEFSTEHASIFVAFELEENLKKNLILSISYTFYKLYKSYKAHPITLIIILAHLTSIQNVEFRKILVKINYAKNKTFYASK
jgi:hypothetical protein